MSKGNLAHHHTCPAFCPRYIFENVVAGSCTCATCQIRRFYEGEGDSSTCLPHGEAFAKHIKVINEGILEGFAHAFSPHTGQVYLVLLDVSFLRVASFSLLRSWYKIAG